MDKNEFISLVLPLKDRLFRVAWCILRSKEEAEDIVQDVMLKVWRDEKGKVENLAAYCYTMARNLALNRLVLKDNRSKELEGAYEQEVQEQPLENIIRTEKMKLLYRMIDGLPGLQRDVVQLRDMEGLSYRDIAKTLQVTEEQVKAETSRCLSCGASVVDPNKCIGCGVCTTKCVFDAIHLHRELPECSRMVKAEDKMKAILPYMLKREVKIRFGKKEK